MVAADGLGISPKVGLVVATLLRLRALALRLVVVPLLVRLVVRRRKAIGRRVRDGMQRTRVLRALVEMAAARSRRVRLAHSRKSWQKPFSSLVACGRHFFTPVS